jgi:shikimate dehydrogenase
MIHLGLIGYPIGHSLSPRLHTAALEACGLEGNYSLFPITPDDRQSLKDLFSRVRSGEIHGLNVTIPHKQNVIPYLDELTPTATSIGAVNTIYLRDNKLIGDNTDAQGFLIDLKNFLTTGTLRHGELKALVSGAGGAARAVVYALLNDGWNVTIAARRMEQAEQLAASFTDHKLRTLAPGAHLPWRAVPGSVGVTNYQLSNIELSNISLLVNTTPVGMTPNIDQSPWPEKFPFPPHAAIYDLVYNPRKTKLVQDAHHQGLHAATGLGMLLEQAALSFEIWTGRNPSREIMRAAARQSPVSNYQLPLTDPGAS